MIRPGGLGLDDASVTRWALANQIRPYAATWAWRCVWGDTDPETACGMLQMRANLCCRRGKFMVARADMEAIAQREFGEALERVDGIAAQIFDRMCEAAIGAIGWGLPAAAQAAAGVARSARPPPPPHYVAAACREATRHAQQENGKVTFHG